MRKVFIGLFAAMVLVTLLPLGAAHAASHPKTITADAFGRYNASVGSCWLATVHVTQTNRVWTIGLKIEFDYLAPDGTCHPTYPNGNVYGSTSTAASTPTARIISGTFRSEPGLTHATVDAVVQGIEYEGFHDLHHAILMPVHLTWTATSKKTVNPDGSVQRDGTVSGTIASCGESFDECVAHPDCTPPPCTNKNVQTLFTFASASGSLGKSS